VRRTTRDRSSAMARCSFVDEAGHTRPPAPCLTRVAILSGWPSRTCQEKTTAARRFFRAAGGTWRVRGTSAGGKRRGRRAARAMLGARPCACRSLPRAVSTPRTLPLHVHGRHLDVSWRVVASCVTQHAPPCSQAHSSDATTAVGTSPEPPRFDDRVTGGRTVTCRADPSRPTAAHTTDRLWKCGHLACWARGPRPCGNSRPRCCAA